LPYETSAHDWLWYRTPIDLFQQGERHMDRRRPPLFAVAPGYPRAVIAYVGDGA
jgi:hypothetical protein